MAGIRAGLLLLWVLSVVCNSEEEGNADAWRVVHSDGVGLREIRMNVGLLTVSADGGYVVGCGEGYLGGGHLKQAGGREVVIPWLTFWRLTMYPNLYPTWPLLLYGNLRANSSELGKTAHHDPGVMRSDPLSFSIRACSVSEDGEVVLWSSLDATGSLMVRLARRCEKSEYSNVLFETVHHRDGHNAAWREEPITFSVPPLFSALSRDGKWLATVSAGGKLQIMPLCVQEGCKDTAHELNVASQGAGSGAALVFSPDSQCVLFLSSEPSLSAACLQSSRRKEEQHFSQGWHSVSLTAYGAASVLLSSCLSTATMAGQHGSLRRSLWSKDAWAGDCDQETLWGARKACGETGSPERFLLVVAGCAGGVDALLVTRSIGKAASLSVQHLQSLVSSSASTEAGSSGTVVSVSASGKVIAIAQHGSKAVSVFEWVHHISEIANKHARAPWGSWELRGVVDLDGGGGVEGLAVLVLRRTYVLVSSSDGFRVVMGPHDNDQSVALSRQDAVDVRVLCLPGVDRRCTQRHADYLQEWYGLVSVSPLPLLLLAVPLIIFFCRPAGHEGMRTHARRSSAPRPTRQETGALSRSPKSKSRRVGGVSTSPRRVGASSKIHKGFWALIPQYGKLMFEDAFLWLDIHARVVSNVACMGLFLFSLYEIVFDRPFLNDWPAHLHHVEQFLEGRLDYSAYMHHHGHNSYGAVFVYIYTTLYHVTGGSVHAFQLIWALVEVLHLRSLVEMSLTLGCPAHIALLCILSNRLHLYNVRVISMDLLPNFITVAALRLLLFKKYAMSSFLYGISISFKLNSILYLPGFVWALWRSSSSAAASASSQSKSTIMSQIAWIVPFPLSIAVTAVPFLLAQAREYTSSAFNLSRTLVWDKTRVLRHVGRLVFASDLLRWGLLLSGMACLCLLLKRVDARWRGMSPFERSGLPGRRAIALAVLGSNQVMLLLARGLYTPFLAWFFYTLPLVLHLSEIPVLPTCGAFLAHEILFRNFDDPSSELWASSLLWAVHLGMLLGVLTVILK